MSISGTYYKGGHPTLDRWEDFEQNGQPLTQEEQEAIQLEGGTAFRLAHPEFVLIKDNANALVKWLDHESRAWAPKRYDTLQKMELATQAPYRGAPCTLHNLEVAYHALLAEGKLQTEPFKAEPQKNKPVPVPVVVRQVEPPTAAEKKLIAATSDDPMLSDHQRKLRDRKLRQASVKLCPSRAAIYGVPQS